MKRTFLLPGIAALLLVILVVLIASQANILGEASPWAGIAPTEIPPLAKTQLAAAFASQTAEAAASKTPTQGETPAPHPTNTSWLPNPTFYPPVKATQLSRMIQTQQAGKLLPTADLQNVYPSFPHGDGEDVLRTKKVGPLAGYGIFTDAPAPVVQQGPNVGVYAFHDGDWEEDRYDTFVSVFAGHLRAEPEQGVVVVIFHPHWQKIQDGYYFESPQPVGDLRLTGAVGERLILTSSQGAVLYFDIPALSFVDSLGKALPTATPVPTRVPYVAPFYTDDAPDEPGGFIDFPPNNTDLSFLVDSPQDRDWFHFYSPKPGTITVSLVRLGGAYGLRVVRLIDDPTGSGGEIVGEDTTPGQGKKQVLLPEAPAGDYLVRVWSLDGSFDPDKPYLLRFEAPLPERVTPILECVADNGDGTYTAHFGYDNPNPFVTVVGADRDNTFHPGPVFRTGQPEAFAPGRVLGWFGVLFDGEGLTWVLDGQAVTANRNSPRCR